MPYVTTGVLVSPLWSIWSGGLRIKMEANPEAAQGKSSEMCTQICVDGGVSSISGLQPLK